MRVDAQVLNENINEISIKNRPHDDENLYEWCTNWSSKSAEAKKPEFAHVKRFCESVLLSDNDADRFQTQQYLAAIYREMKKFDIIITNIVMRLSNYNDTKKEYLMNQGYKIPMYLGVCYWSLHEGFKKYCVDSELNKHVRTFRHIFAHACQADWLSVKEVLECFEDVCQDVKLFTNIPRPPAFLPGFEDI